MTVVKTIREWEAELEYAIMALEQGNSSRESVLRRILELVKKNPPTPEGRAAGQERPRDL